MFITSLSLTLILLSFSFHNEFFKIVDFDYDERNILENEIFGNDNPTLEKTGVLEEINGGTIFFKNIDSYYTILLFSEKI